MTTYLFKFCGSGAETLHSATELGFVWMEAEVFAKVAARRRRKKRAIDGCYRRMFQMDVIDECHIRMLHRGAISGEMDGCLGWVVPVNRLNTGCFSLITK